MKYLPYIIGIFFLGSQAACVFNPKPIPVDIDEPEQRLVISSFAIPPQELLVTVSRTFSALLAEGDSLDLADDVLAERILVDSALVLIRYGGKTVELFKIAPGVYGSLEVEQQPGQTYRLSVYDYDTGLETTAETTLLPTVSLDTVYPVVSVLPNLGDTLRTFEYVFLDPFGAENYFLATYTNLNQISSGNILNPNGSLFNFSTERFSVFADQSYGDGQTIEFQPRPLFAQGDTVLVGLSNIPKGYYDFLSAYKKSGNLFTQIISEPINLPTNISQGYGYFAMIKPSIRMVIIK
jgi:hypothetical protein